MSTPVTRVALITGGTGGIGRAAARRLSRDHDAVAFAHRSAAEAADSLVADLEERGVSSLPIEADFLPRASGSISSGQLESIPSWSTK